MGHGSKLGEMLIDILLAASVNIGYFKSVEVGRWRFGSVLKGDSSNSDLEPNENQKHQYYRNDVCKHCYASVETDI